MAARLRRRGRQCDPPTHRSGRARGDRAPPDRAPAVNVVLKVVASAVLGITALATQGFGLASGESGIRTVEITIHHSRFTPAVVDVKRGSTVRFVVRNTDPI